jgi:ribosomal protein S3
MGQKTNPNIFQLGKTNNWQSKCFEKKIAEYSIYPKKDLEIRNFIQKFFKDHGRIIHYCKLCYLEKTLHVFISYHLNLNTLAFTNNNIPKIYTIEKKKRTKEELEQQKISSRLENLKSKTFNEQIRQITKKIGYKKKKIVKAQMVNSIEKKEYNKDGKLQNNFDKKFSESLTNFTLKKFKLIIQLKALNTNIDTISRIRTKKFLKKKLVNLRKYKQTEFFQAGVNTLFTCATNNKSSKLLAQFIAIQLKNLKRHSFFLKFIKSTLSLLNNNVLSKFKGIKIKIKGRLNGRPRARSQVFKIANDVSVLTINSTINYSEETAFTPNGTLGIKVWIHESSD